MARPSPFTRIRSTGHSSARYGVCEVCRTPAGDVHVGSSSDHGHIIFGHVECLRRTDAIEVAAANGYCPAP